MKRVRVAAMVLCVAVLAGNPVFAGEKAEKKKEVTVTKEKLSYALGVNIGTMIKRDFKDKVDAAVLYKGVSDVLAGKETEMTLPETKTIIEAAAKQSVAERKAGKLRVAEEYLAKNKKKEGVQVLPSGLQYRVLVKGVGKTPTARDTVTVNFTGALIDGTVFDSSEKRKGATTFPVTGVIQGWSEALQHMKEGSRWQLFIPPDLAYGEGGREGIPEYAVLVFDVELLKVNDNPVKARPQHEAAKAEKAGKSK